MRALVVGGGIVGLCSAWALRRDGWRVELIEQGSIPNPDGSSCDQHRLIRHTYGSLHGYARMVDAAYAGWDALWRDLGRSLYRPTGTLATVRDGDDGWVRASIESLDEFGQPYETLTPAELHRRWPQLTGAGLDWALYTPGGGALLAREIAVDLTAHLRRGGCTVTTQTRVTAVDCERARLRLADGGERAGDALVIAAGPWVGRLLPELAQRVTPSRQVYLYLDPPPAFAAAWRDTPMLLDQIAATRGGFYAVPPVAGTGLKVGDHGFSLRGEPDAERAPTDVEVAAVMALCRDRLSDFAGYRVAAAHTCFYSVTAGERFIAERRGRAWVLAGFSGHGFKFGAAIGLALADTLAGRRDPAAFAGWMAGELAA